MTVFNAVLALKPRHAFHGLLRIPHLNRLCVDAHRYPLPNESARHRITVVLYADRAAPGNAHLDLLVGLQSTLRQWLQLGPFLFKLGLTPLVQLFEQLLQERCIGLATPKIAAAPQRELIAYRQLEPIVTLLNLAILMRTSGLRMSGLQPTMT